MTARAMENKRGNRLRCLGGTLFSSASTIPAPSKQ